MAEVTKARTREIELSSLNILKETATLAHSRITDIITWDAEGNVKLKPSSQIPEHAVGAISEISRTFDKQGNPQLNVKMHPKIRPIDLAGQHLSLWEDAKRQAQKRLCQDSPQQAVK